MLSGVLVAKDFTHQVPLLLRLLVCLLVRLCVRFVRSFVFVCLYI